MLMIPATIPATIPGETPVTIPADGVSASVPTHVITCSDPAAWVDGDKVIVGSVGITYTLNELSPDILVMSIGEGSVDYALAEESAVGLADALSTALTEMGSLYGESVAVRSVVGAVLRVTGGTSWSPVQGGTTFVITEGTWAL